MSRRKRIGIIIYSNPDHYPPTVNAVKILSALFDLVIVARSYEKPCINYPQGVTIYRLGKPCIAAEKDNQNPVKKVLEYLSFIVLSRRLVRKAGCGLVYAYDMHGFIAGLCACFCGKRIPLIYHNHDLLEKTGGISLNNLVNWLQFRLSRYADKVVLPDLHRARYFKEKAHLSSLPDVVMNTPLYQKELPEEKLRGALALRGIGGDFRIVLYQGGIDKWRSIPEVIASMKWWPDKTALVLIGIIFDEEVRRLLLEAQDGCGPEKRIVYLDYMSHDELFNYLCGADLGLALYKPGSLIMQLYGSGGSNKIFEYLALGVPVVTSDSPFFKEILAPDYLYFADPYSPEKIGEVICLALDDTRGRKEKSIAARRAHLDGYYYEKQFSHVLEYIKRTVG